MTLYQQPDWLAHTLEHLGVSLFYGNGLVYGAYPFPNIVLWSLEYEVQFYLLAPLLTLVFLLRPAPARRLAIIALMLLPKALSPLMEMAPWLGWTLLGKLEFFLAGFLLCDLYLAGHLRTEKLSYYWDAAFLAAFSAVVLLSPYPLGYQLLPWWVLLAGVSAFRGRVTNWLLSRPFLTIIGGMCYTIYMYHWLMISGLIRFTKKFATHIFWLDLLINFAVMSVIIIAICAVLFALFERPFMQRDWPQRFWAWSRRKSKNN